MPKLVFMMLYLDLAHDQAKSEGKLKIWRPSSGIMHAR